MTDMIGRVDESAAVARFVARVASGRAGLLIEGEPGIGKTTLLSGVVDAALERGYQVLQARPAEAEADLSYAGLADLIGAVFDDVRDALPTPQRQALEIALLLRAADTPADPRTTASALLTAITILSLGEPVVIVIDDAHWLDGATRRAVQFAARRLPPCAGIVVASRVEASGSAAFGPDLGIEPETVERVVLGALSLASLHHLLDQRLHLRLARPLLVRVAEASGGNPLYALEIAAAIARDPAPPALGDPLPVPGTLQDLLRDRVNRLSASARSVVSTAAALSRPTAETITAAIGLDVDVDAALAEAEDAGVLVSDGHRRRFAHPLLAAAILGSLSVERRRVLHRRLAAVVSDPEERARHLARGVTGPDEEAAAAVEAAAALATRRGAPEAAAELYEAASTLTSSQQVDDLARRTLGAADARAVAGDLNGARALAARAAELGQTGSLRARAFLLLGSLASYTDTIEDRVALQERALREAGHDVELRIDILLALFEQIAVDPVSAARRADEVIRLLRERDEPGRLAQALISRFVAEAVLGQGADARLLREGLALEARAAGPRSMYPLIWAHWIDDLDATRARARVLDARYRDHGDIVGAAEIVEFVAMAEFRAGDWAGAEQALEEACATLAQFDARGPFIASFADRSVIDAHRGRVDRARATLRDILGGSDRLDAFWRMVCHSAQGAVEFCAGQPEAADQAWTAMHDERQVVGWIDFLDDRSEPDHIEALIALGRLDEAHRVLERLEWRGRTLPRTWIDASLPRARALVLAAEGRQPEAVAIIEAAAPTPALPFETARLLLARGQIERRANRKLAARGSLSRALGEFERLGSPPWVERTRGEIARLGLRHQAPGLLTEGERRMAELAASGMTNRQVAEAAFVSPKTVEANLARVYRKLGIGSRAELGARMSAMSGVVDDQT